MGALVRCVILTRTLTRKIIFYARTPTYQDFFSTAKLRVWWARNVISAQVEERQAALHILWKFPNAKNCVPTHPLPILNLSFWNIFGTIFFCYFLRKKGRNHVAHIFFQEFLKRTSSYFKVLFLHFTLITWEKLPTQVSMFFCEEKNQKILSFVKYKYRNTYTNIYKIESFIYQENELTNRWSWKRTAFSLPSSFSSSCCRTSAIFIHQMKRMTSGKITLVSHTLSLCRYLSLNTYIATFLDVDILFLKSPVMH